MINTTDACGLIELYLFTLILGLLNLLNHILNVLILIPLGIILRFLITHLFISLFHIYLELACKVTLR